MGGDDLGSDDEFLTEQISDAAHVQAPPTPRDNVVVAESKKRKLSDTADDDDDKKEDPDKKKKSFTKVLLAAGRNLEEQTAEQQAAFLSTALRHQILMTSNEDLAAESKLLQHHFRTSSKETLLERLKDGVAIKRMKTWKNIKSPCVVVICISAKRAVEVLKELSGTKVRAAKLFAKHMKLAEQSEQLQTIPFGLAVGTPNRLRALCDGGDLSFAHTQLVILDCQVSNKAFTVCTLPDTAPDTMSLLSEFAVPQLKKRKDIRLAFF
jgi:protein CMS1